MPIIPRVAAADAMFVLPHDGDDPDVVRPEIGDFDRADMQQADDAAQQPILLPVVIQDTDSNDSAESNTSDQHDDTPVVIDDTNTGNEETAGGVV